MTSVCFLMFAVFVLSCLLGYIVISDVTPSLHAPLMSVSNAVSGIVVVGAMVALSFSQTPFVRLLCLMAMFLASVNIFGGFGVSWRMLRLFRRKDRK